MELTGKLIEKGETKTFGNNGFTKREFVIETEDQYPQKIQIELVKDKTALIDPIQIGQAIKVSININGRSWVNPQGETKYFNSIQGWKIESSGIQEPFETTSDLNEENDDLPY